MEKIIITADCETPCRIDKYLYDELDDYSRNRIQRLILDGAVLLNSQPAKKNQKVLSGELIEINLPDVKQVETLPEDIPLNVVYEDEDLIVVNKERGMVVHPAPGHSSGTLVNALMYHIKDLSSVGGYMRPGIVHRIDKDTTGLLMVAKNDAAHLSLSDQLRARSVSRLYTAIVHGGFKEPSGSVDKPIGRDKKDRLKMAIDMAGRSAKTNYRILENLGIYTLLELKLESGRTHQIRVHMRSIGHPLLGDPVYGSRNDKYKSIGQLLHAGTLGFDHPRTGERMSFEVDLPDDFKRVLSEIRGNLN